MPRPSLLATPAGSSNAPYAELKVALLSDWPAVQGLPQHMTEFLPHYSTSTSIPELRCVLSSIDQCRILVDDFRSRFGQRTTANKASLALLNFTQKLFLTRGVDAAAFLAARGGHWATTLSIEVITPLRRHDELTAETVRRVTEADAELTEALACSVPVGLRFINSSRLDLETLELRLRNRWADSAALNPLAFLVFQRD